MEQEGDIQLGQQKHPKYDSGSNVRPYLRVDNVRDGWIDTSNVLRMHFPENELGKFELNPGDILLNEGQTREATEDQLAALRSLLRAFIGAVII
jgi:type I restriction enzyme S subunit